MVHIGLEWKRRVLFCFVGSVGSDWAVGFLDNAFSHNWKGFGRQAG